jgi:hypothetical protein
MAAADVAVMETSRVRCSDAPLTHPEADVKKLIAAVAPLALVAACHSSAPPPASTPSPVPTRGVLSGNLTGAPDATSAVRAFMAAVKATDLQAMGALWGDVQGPARDALPRDELEKREFIMMCSLRHDRFQILPDVPGRNGSRSVPVAVSLGSLTRTTTFTVVQGPERRWYVQNVDLEHMQEFCSRRPQ